MSICLGLSNRVVHVYLRRAEHLYCFGYQEVILIFVCFLQAIQILFHLLFQRKSIDVLLKLAEVISEVCNHLVSHLFDLEQYPERAESVSLAALENLGHLLHL